MEAVISVEAIVLDVAKEAVLIDSDVAREKAEAVLKEVASAENDSATEEKVETDLQLEVKVALEISKEEVIEKNGRDESVIL